MRLEYVIGAFNLDAPRFAVRISCHKVLARFARIELMHHPVPAGQQASKRRLPTPALAPGFDALVDEWIESNLEKIEIRRNGVFVCWSNGERVFHTSLRELAKIAIRRENGRGLKCEF